MNQNPYASPNVLDSTDEAFPAMTAPVTASPTWRKAFLRWGLICYGCAIPSFFWGLTVVNGPFAIFEMLLGIACFVLVYASVEVSRIYQERRNSPHLRKAIRAGFGFRLAISIIFPLGMYVDMLTGAIAMNITNLEALTRDGANQSHSPLFRVFLTTIVQGIMVNMWLLTLMLFVFVSSWTISYLFGKRRDHAISN